LIKKLTINELFSGVGSQRKALERLKVPHKVVGISEIDKYAIKSYEAMFGDTRNYGDISRIEKLDYADFWTYSFPCQDISVSGKMKGIEDGTRSGLLYQIERLLNVSKNNRDLPKYLMLENVKNLVGKKFKKQFDKWLEYLDELGYNNYWEVLNAKNYGVPQNRERVFVISIRKDIDMRNFEFPKGFDNGIRLKDILEESVDERFYIREDLQNKFREQFASKLNLVETTGCYVCNKGNNMEGLTDICSTLMARDYKGFGNQRMTGVAELQQIGTLKGCGMPYDKMHDQSCRIYDPEGIAPTIHTCGGGNLEPKIVASRGRYVEDGKIEQQFEVNDTGNTNTITTIIKDNYVVEPQVLRPERNDYGKQIRKAYEAGEVKESRHNMTELHPRKDGVANTLTTVQKDNLVFEPSDFRIRKLTPKECWRLMGFDDGDFEKARSVNSNSQLYKQAGNSIVVNVLYYTFRNIFSEYIAEDV
jgi:DNA (cytosine-5)-methyltransferase 1